MHASYPTNWRVVSVGLIYKDNQVLLGLRYPKADKKNRWEFPGGSIEKGELPQETIHRELREELEITVEKSELANCLCDYKQNQPYIIVFYHILKWSGSPKKTCHQKLKWFSLEECNQQQLPNINPHLFMPIYKTLKEKLKS
ncbi:MAG: NUDIX domain-containing protein [Bdellovibrionales bacterium]